MTLHEQHDLALAQDANYVCIKCNIETNFKCIVDQTYEHLNQALNWFNNQSKGMARVFSKRGLIYSK